MDAAFPHRVTATGEAWAAPNGSTGGFVLQGVRLAGGSAASSAVIREVDNSGAILAELKCVATAADECNIPIRFRTALHVTLAGTGATCTVYV